MNYSILVSKGSRYLLAAGDNWSRRIGKLIDAWGREPSAARRLRIAGILRVLEARLTALTENLHALKEQRYRLEAEAENQIVLLHCPRMSCRYGPEAVALGVRVGTLLKDGPGKYKCEKCGSALVQESDKGIDDLLFEMGIITNDDESI